MATAAEQRSRTTTATTLAPRGQVNPDLSKMAQQYGVSFGGGTYTDPDDPVLTWSRKDYIDPGDEYRFVNGRPNDAATVSRTETKKLSEAMGDFYKLGKGDVEQLQDKLIRSGVLDRKSVVKGAHDPATAKAYRAVLEHAAEYNKGDPNKTFQEILDEIASGSGPTEPGNAFKLSNPEEISIIADKVAQITLGRRLNDDEKSVIIGNFQTQELSAQQQAAALEDQIVAGNDVVVTKAPTFDESYADAQLRQSHPQEAQAHDFAGNAEEFYKLIEESANAVKQY